MPGARGPAAPADARAPRRASARSRATDVDGYRAGEAGRPDHHRRPHAVDARGDRRAGAPLPARARQLPPRRLDLPVADARLPRLDRDRRPRRTCTASRTSSGGTASEQRLVEYGSSFAALRASGLVQGLRDTVVNLNERHLLQERRDGLRGARGRGPHDCGDQHHDLPRPQPPPLADPRLPAGARAEAVLLLQRLRVRQDRRADRLPQPLARLDRRLRGDDRPLARDARRLRPARPLPARTTTTPRTRSAPTPRTRRSRRADASIAALFDAAGGAGRVPRALRASSSAPTTASRRSSRRRGSRSPGALVTASNRAAMLYGDDPRRLAEALDGEPSVDVALFLEDGEVVARRRRRRGPGAPRRATRTAGRAPRAALRNPNAGEVLVSAAPGLGVRRPRRPPPRRRRQPRLARARPTRRCRCSRSASASRPRRSPGSRACCSPTSASRWPTRPERAAARPTWIDRQLVAARHPRRARPRRDGARCRARLFVPAGVPRRAPTTTRRSRSRSARRSPSPTWSRSCARRSASTGTSACSTSAPARATRRPCSPSSPREVHTIERIPELAETARAALAAAGYERVAGSRRRRLARAARARAVRRDRRRRRGRRRCRPRSGRSSRDGGRIALPLATGGRAPAPLRPRAHAAAGRGSSPRFRPASCRSSPGSR